MTKITFFFYFTIFFIISTLFTNFFSYNAYISNCPKLPVQHPADLKSEESVDQESGIK